MIFGYIKKILGILILIALAIILIAIWTNRDKNKSGNQQSFREKGIDQPESKVSVVAGDPIRVIATDLNTPWEVAFLPNEEILITQRTGSLLHFKANKNLETNEIETLNLISQLRIDEATEIGEGGLLGLAVHPNFSQNRWIYVYLTVNISGRYENRVERYDFSNGQLGERKTILDGILGAAIHDGGRLAFGPDEKLYISTGDAGEPRLAQETSSLNGKILRLNDDGSIPADNPFGNEVYSYGHRNPQGLAWDEDGNFWSTEHGPSGAGSGYDEVNLIVKGGNYGWPDIQGDQVKEGMLRPVIHSGARDTWAPAGLVAYQDYLFYAGLRGGALYRVKRQGTNLEEPVPLFKEQYGRLRAVAFAPNNYLFLATSNTDGRGDPGEDDDRLFQVDPQSLIISN